MSSLFAYTMKLQTRNHISGSFELLRTGVWGVQENQFSSSSLVFLQVNPGSVAAGNLSPGDVVLKIGNVNATNITHTDAQEIIKGACNILQLTIKKYVWTYIFTDLILFIQSSKSYPSCPSNVLSYFMWKNSTSIWALVGQGVTSSNMMQNDTKQPLGRWTASNHRSSKDLHVTACFKFLICCALENLSLFSVLSFDCSLKNQSFSYKIP